MILKRKEMESESHILTNMFGLKMKTMAAGRMLGMVKGKADLTDHQVRTKRFVEHIKALVKKNNTKQDEQSVMSTSKVVNTDSHVESWDTKQVSSSIARQIKKKRVENIDRRNIVNFIKA